MFVIILKFLYEAFTRNWDPSSHCLCYILIYHKSVVYDIHDELFSKVIFKKLVTWQEHLALKCFKYIRDLYVNLKLASSNIRLILVFSKQYFIQNKTTPRNMNDFIRIQIWSSTLFWWTLLRKKLALYLGICIT